MEIDKVSLILPYNDDLEILFQNRMKISKHGEKYGFFGGHLENNESPEEALKREVKEELNLDIEELPTLKFFKKFIFHVKELNMIGERNVFIVKIPNLKDIKINEGEGKIIKFKDIFNLELSGRDEIMLKEIYDFLIKK